MIIPICCGLPLAIEIFSLVTTMILLAKVEHPNGMMQNVVGPIVVRIGPPYDTYEGKILIVSPYDGIDDVEPLPPPPPDCERNDA
jgi:hypothetical protein